MNNYPPKTTLFDGLLSGRTVRLALLIMTGFTNFFTKKNQSHIASVMKIKSVLSRMFVMYVLWEIKLSVV